MSKEKLTNAIWKHFCNKCLDGKPVDQKLFDICVEFFPFEADNIPAAAKDTLTVLRNRYRVTNVDENDVGQFFNRFWLKHSERKYSNVSLPPEPPLAIPEHSPIPSYILRDAELRTLHMIKDASPQAYDIFGEAYVKSFFQNFSA